MNTHRHYHLALTLLLLCAVAAVLLAVVSVSVSVMGMRLTLVAGLAAIVGAGVLFAAMAFVHGALRAARWNAGHRLR